MPKLPFQFVRPFLRVTKIRVSRYLAIQSYKNILYLLLLWPNRHFLLEKKEKKYQFPKKKLPWQHFFIFSKKRTVDVTLWIHFVMHAHSLWQKNLLFSKLWPIWNDILDDISASEIFCLQDTRTNLFFIPMSFYTKVPM